MEIVGLEKEASFGLLGLTETEWEDRAGTVKNCFLMLFMNSLVFVVFRVLPFLVMLGMLGGLTELS